MVIMKKTQIIEIKNLTKQFNGLTAVDAIDLSIDEGELFGLLGPNGAGKTTAISMLSTILKPTSGSARLCGFDVMKKQDAVRKCIGIVFQDPSLDDELTGWENLDFHGRLYGMDKKTRRERIEDVLALVELEDKAKNLVRTYSGGMKRRLEIARGLMHRPKVLFLDEPTLGLDPQTRRRIWEYIEKMNKEEKITIILTTHYIEEANYLCDRVAFMDQGKIIVMDTPKNLINKMGGDSIYLKMSKEDAEKILPRLERQKWTKKIKNVDGSLCMNVENAERLIPKIISTAQKLGAVIESVETHKPTLEDVFIHYTGRKIREEEASEKDGWRNTAMRRGIK